MTQEEKERIIQKLRERALDNQKNGVEKEPFPGDPWENDSLAKVIKTKEQADSFMMLLEIEANK